MPSSHFILCCPLLLLPSIFPSIRVFSSETALPIRWPKYWSFSFSSSPSNEYQGWFPLGLTGLISLLSKGLSRVFSSATVRKHQFFGVLPSLWSNFHICTWLLLLLEQGLAHRSYSKNSCWMKRWTNQVSWKHGWSWVFVCLFADGLGVEKTLQMLPIVGVEFRPDPEDCGNTGRFLAGEELNKDFFSKDKALCKASLHQQWGEGGPEKRNRSRFICHQKNYMYQQG